MLIILLSFGVPIFLNLKKISCCATQHFKKRGQECNSVSKIIWYNLRERAAKGWTVEPKL